jgi:hypothetical protein
MRGYSVVFLGVHLRNLDRRGFSACGSLALLLTAVSSTGTWESPRYYDSVLALHGFEKTPRM